jgi:peroxiredoxin
MVQQRVRIATFGAGVLLVATAAHAALETREVTTMAGKTAPAIQARSVQGNSVTTQAGQGKVLLVNFFASWCPPCQKELGHLKELRARLPADKVMIVGVAMDAVMTLYTVPEVKPMVEKAGLNFPVVLATKALVGAYQCPGFPATYVISPEGKFVKALFGYHPLEKVSAEVNALLPNSASR